MKLTLDAAVNVLLGVTCVVITSVGVMDLRVRLSGAAPPAASAQPAAANPPNGAMPRPSPVEDVRDITIPTSQSIIKAHGTPKVALVEFSDFECPFCGAFERGAYEQIQRDFIDTGKVEYVFVDFPRESLHPHALDAAQAFRCAAEQGKPWEMHDKLFQNQKALTKPDLLAAAQALGLKSDAFTRCLAGKTVQRFGLSWRSVIARGCSERHRSSWVKLTPMVRSMRRGGL